jgi:hypothetical protein
MEELKTIKKQVEQFLPSIGSHIWERYLGEEAKLDNMEEKIQLWNDILNVYSRHSNSDDDGD